MFDYKCPLQSERFLVPGARAPKRHSAATTMAEVTEEQIREYVQMQATIDALRKTEAYLQQQLADTEELAQEMAALSFSAEPPLHSGNSPDTRRKKRRGGSMSDDGGGGGDDDDGGGGGSPDLRCAVSLQAADGKAPSSAS